MLQENHLWRQLALELIFSKVGCLQYALESIYYAIHITGYYKIPKVNDRMDFKNNFYFARVIYVFKEYSSVGFSLLK